MSTSTTSCSAIDMTDYGRVQEYVESISVAGTKEHNQLLQINQVDKIKHIKYMESMKHLTLELEKKVQLFKLKNTELETKNSELETKNTELQTRNTELQTKNIEEFRNYQEEYTWLVTDPDRISWISSKVKEFSLTGNTLVLVNRIDTGKKIMEQIPEAVFVAGEMKLADRKEEYDEIKTSDGKVIIATYGVAAVGINIPRIFNLVLIEPGKSFVRVIQSIGRGIRKAEDKDFVQIWDITSTCKYAKRHLTERKKFYREAKYPFQITKIDT